MKKLISAALATVAALLGLYAATPSTAHAAVRAGHTAVTVKVSNCNGCQVSATSWMRLHTQPWISAVRTVRHGKVTFYPPTSRTKGLAFTITDPRAVNDGAVPVAILRDSNVHPGHAVTARQAAAAKHGYPCWAGTSARSATIRLSVAHFPGRAVNGKRGYLIRVYGNPALHGVGDRRATPNGVYETQDIPLCIG